MKTSDLTLRALERLTPEEARELESILADDPQLAADLRATEDAMAAIWHAASPLVPAPDGSFEAIQARLHPIRNRHLKTKALTYGGWAAALAMVAVLMSRPPSTRSPAVVISPVVPVSAADSPREVPEKPADASVVPTRRRNDYGQRSLRETVLALQQELRAVRAGAAGPRIRELRSPSAGLSGAATDPGLALRDLLTAALTEDLARRTEMPTTLTVETGWTPAAFAALPAGSLVRHRSFPVKNFPDFGLLRAASGEFYDPATRFRWSPAEDGGGYLGSRVPATQDLAVFRPAPANPDPETSPGVVPDLSVPPDPAVTAAVETPVPSGYLVQGQDDENATVVIGNLPTTDPSPQLIASVDGGMTLVPLTDGVIVPGPDGTGFASFSLPNSLLQNTSFGGSSHPLVILQNNSMGVPTVILTTDP